MAGKLKEACARPFQVESSEGNHFLNASFCLVAEFLQQQAIPVPHRVNPMLRTSGFYPETGYMIYL